MHLKDSQYAYVKVKSLLCDNNNPWAFRRLVSEEKQILAVMKVKLLKQGWVSRMGWMVPLIQVVGRERSNGAVTKDSSKGSQCYDVGWKQE